MVCTSEETPPPHFKLMTNSELTLDQLQQVKGGLLSAGEVFDFWVDVFLGDTIDDIKSSADKVKKMEKENSVHQPPGTEDPGPGVWY